ncbi:MAG: copper chaperone PCu(A)C [Proteobacteria bacterium]|nr:copper chaperone PCu(A)C [Pseudomonadota bacterium]
MHKTQKIKLSFFLLLILFYDFTLAGEGQDINISNVWISEAPPTVSVLAAYAIIQNNTAETKTLSAVSSPIFSRVEIHLSKIIDDMVTMEKQSSLTIPAESSTELSPGNYHLMLFDPKAPLTAGDKATLIFTFADGQSVSVQASVEKRRSKGHDHHHH